LVGRHLEGANFRSQYSLLGPIARWRDNFTTFLAALMGDRDVKTALTVYAHLINTDDHTGNMAALGAMATPTPKANNVIPLHG
jgi:hypothetical protein